GGWVVEEVAADLMLLGDSRDGRGAGERVEREALWLGGVQSLGGAGSRGVEGLGTVGGCMMDEHVGFLLRPGVCRRHQCREETGGLKRLDRPQRSRRLLPRVEPGPISWTGLPRSLKSTASRSGNFVPNVFLSGIVLL